MTRVKRGVRTRARHRKILKQAKGYFGHKSKLFKVANQIGRASCRERV